LLLEAPEARALSPFFEGLKQRVLSSWQSKEGLAYDRVLYAVSYPYAKQDIDRVLAWAGGALERASLPPLRELNRMLMSRPYPQVAPLAPEGLSAQSWSALLHFLDPSYPLATDRSYAGVQALGFALPQRLDTTAYPRYLAALDTLKDEAPVFAVPETNWYLARVIQVGLERWAST